MLASWRKSLEQSLFAGGQTFPFGQPPEARGGVRTPGSPNTNRSETPHTDRQTPLDGRFGQEGSKTPSDDGRLSPGGRSEDSRSPGKAEGVSPTPSPHPPSFPGLVPRSFANSVNVSSSTNNTNSSNSQLSIPPLFTSRIPKGDPLEERLHDMLR